MLFLVRILSSNISSFIFSNISSLIFLIPVAQPRGRRRLRCDARSWLASRVLRPVQHCRLFRRVPIHSAAGAPVCYFLTLNLRFFKCFCCRCACLLLFSVQPLSFSGVGCGRCCGLYPGPSPHVLVWGGEVEHQDVDCGSKISAWKRKRFEATTVNFSSEV